MVTTSSHYRCDQVGLNRSDLFRSIPLLASGGHRGLTRQPENSKRPREDPQEREERMKTVAGEGKKARNFGPPTLQAPFGPPPFLALTFLGSGPSPLGLPPFGPEIFGPRLFLGFGPRAPSAHPSNPTLPWAHPWLAQSSIGPSGTGQNRLNWLVQSGLA